MDIQQTTTIGEDIEAFINMQCEYDELRQLVTNLPYHLQISINYNNEIEIASAGAFGEKIPNDYYISNADSIYESMEKLSVDYVAYYDSNHGIGGVPMVELILNDFGYSFINTSCNLESEGLYGSEVAYHICDNWYIVYPTPV